MTALGTHKQQPMIGPILLPDMSANWARLAGIIRIYPNRYATRQPGFVCGFGLYIRKTPTAHFAIGLAPSHRSFLRVPTLGAIADVFQPLQTHHRVWLRDGLAHTVRGIRVQPSFSQYQLSQNGFGPASALRLQRTPCTGDTFSKMPPVSARIKTTFPSCIGLHCDVPAVQVHTLDGGYAVHRHGVQRLFDGDQQIPHLGYRVLPELGGTQGNTVVYRVCKPFQMPVPTFVPAPDSAGQRANTINQALKYPIVVCYAEGHEAGRCA